MEYERPYYEDLNYHPFLFYAAFGVADADLEVSRERHHVDEFPAGLDCTLLQKPDNADYMESLTGGGMGKVLSAGYPDLYRDLRLQDSWVVIRGEVEKDSDLHYLRNAIGFIQALVEKGAAGVFDVQTMTLYSPAEWTRQIFAPEFDAFSHVVILSSEMEDGSIWLHTRGMRKFGRPDISMEQVPENEVDTAAQVVNQMIFYGAQGAFYSRPVKLHTQNGFSCVVTPAYIDDMDNPDFNNSFYQASWPECVVEPE